MLSRAFNALCISTTQLYHCLTNQYFVLRESRVNLVFSGGRPKFPCLNTRATGQGGNFRLSRLKQSFELSGCRFSLLGKQNVKHGMTNESAHVSPREGDDAETAGINSKLSSSVLTPAPEMSSFIHLFLGVLPVMKLSRPCSLELDTKNPYSPTC
jgi:hypothetical protein